jgi:indole-3-glycerol phosphate synthase
MILDKIIEVKKGEVNRLKKKISVEKLEESALSMPRSRDFAGAVGSGNCSIIAEVKRSSPSKGRIREDFDPVEIASLYEKNGAAAISVLTDERFFEGSNSYLSEIRKNVSLPLLRKEFIIDPCQIYETKIIGGDAVLLIARILEEETLKRFIDISKSIGLAAVVEVHSEEEIKKAATAGAVITGINNRNLETFSTDLNTSTKLAPHMPKDGIIISESGIRTREDVESLMQNKISAFLIGETLMREPDPGKKLKELLGEEK